MKVISKILISALLTVIVLSLSLIGVGAEAVGMDKYEAVGAPAELGDTIEDATLDAAGGADARADNSEADKKDNVFASAYKATAEYSSEIASIAAAVCSIILAFAMCRGLTPMLKDALGAMTRAVGKIGDSVTEGENRAAEITDALSARINLTESTLDKLSATVEALEEAKAKDAEEALMREDILTVMSAQVELLYDVFMSSALPKYKKEAVSERCSQMRERLNGATGASDEA